MSEMNHHLNFGKETDGKLEYSSLYFEVSDEFVGVDLLILFRAVNFTLSSSQDVSGC
jgi:hypothetical protein